MSADRGRAKAPVCMMHPVGGRAGRRAFARSVSSCVPFRRRSDAPRGWLAASSGRRMVAVLSPNPISLRRAGDAASILPGPAEYPPRPSDAGAIPDAGGFDRPDRTPPAPSAPAARKVAGQASPPVRRDRCRVTRGGAQARKLRRGLVRGLMRKRFVAADALAAFPFPSSSPLWRGSRLRVFHVEHRASGPSGGAKLACERMRRPECDGGSGRCTELLPPRSGRENAGLLSSPIGDGEVDRRRSRRDGGVLSPHRP